MPLPKKMHRLWKHLFWADRKLLEAVASNEGPPPKAAVREFAHVVGTEEVWLARLQRRSPLLAVWPSVPPSDLDELVRQTHLRWRSYMSDLQEADLQEPVKYTNSAGREFENAVEDILLHVALHGQYHRGKVNLLLRDAGFAPSPVDYIAFVRGAPAATETGARQSDRHT